MEYEITIEQRRSRWLLVAGRHVTGLTLRASIPPLFAAVNRYLDAAAIERRGSHVIVYHDAPGDSLLNDAGLDIEAGVEVFVRVNVDGDVRTSSTPAGLVATTVHTGPYEKLFEAHVAVRTWCRAHGRPILGTNWEIYGGRQSDPRALRTEVCYLVDESHA